MLAVQVDESQSLGVDVQIPVGDFATYFTGTDHFTELRDSMTMRESTPSPFRQEQSKVESEAYIQSMMNEAQENASEYIQAQEIFTKVRDQLIDTGAVNAANASVMAEVVPAWATVQAKSRGIPVEQVYQDSGLVIEGPQTGVAAELSAEALTQDFDLESLIAEFDELGLSTELTVEEQLFINEASTPVEKRQRLLESSGLDKEAVWTDERLNDVMRDHARSENALVGFINPAQFVNATHPRPQEIAEETDKLNVDRLRDETQTPFLRVDTDGSIIGHEGRHRMAALNAAGINRVPVLIRKEWGADFTDTVDEQQSLSLKGQEFYTGKGIDIDIDEAYLARNENRDLIKGKMSAEPDVLFQSQQIDQTETESFKEWSGDGEVVKCVQS